MTGIIVAVGASLVVEAALLVWVNHLTSRIDGVEDRQNAHCLQDHLEGE